MCGGRHIPPPAGRPHHHTDPKTLLGERVTVIIYLYCLCFSPHSGCKCISSYTYMVCISHSLRPFVWLVLWCCRRRHIAITTTFDASAAGAVTTRACGSRFPTPPEAHRRSMTRAHTHSQSRSDDMHISTRANACTNYVQFISISLQQCVHLLLAVFRWIRLWIEGQLPSVQHLLLRLLQAHSLPLRLRLR